MDTTHPSSHHVSGAEYAWWTIGAVLGGLFVLPGLCAAVGAGLAFTRFRSLPPVARWGLLAVGIALVVYQLVGLHAGGSGGTVGPASQVN